MSKNHYIFFRKRKDILNHIRNNSRINNCWFDSWFYARKSSRIEDNGYYLLIYDYIENIINEFKKQYGLDVVRFYTKEPLVMVYIPLTKEHTSEKYLDSIHELYFIRNNKVHNFYMSKYLLRSGDGRGLLALYHR